MAKKNEKDPNLDFRTTARVQTLEKLYSDEVSTSRRYDKTPKNVLLRYKTAAAVRAALSKAISNPSEIVDISRKLYEINPIYASVINYLRDMFIWKYRVIPHKVYSKSKAQARKQIKEDDYKVLYNLMLEVAEGLSFKTKCPSILEKLFVEGAVYYTTICDDDSYVIDTLLLPEQYCRKVGETQYGTAIIEFDFSYFRDVGVQEADLDEYFKSFPADFKKYYAAYLKDANNR